MIHVPFLDLKAHHRPLLDEIRAAMDAVLSDAAFILGPAVEEFEQNFARYVGTKHCIGVNSGTTALQLALHACDIGPGDEVITTPMTWISTTWAISYVGATPVFVDVDPNTYTMSPTATAAAITERTKAFLPVHLYGHPADVSSLRQLAEERAITLIEDAAQAHGATLDGQRIGTFGKLACYSFYPGKNLGALGEAGAIVTDDDDLALRIRQLRNHAQQQRHHHVEIGYNARMDGIQGAALNVKLAHLDEFNAARERIAQAYLQGLRGTPGLQLPARRPEGPQAWHLFVVLVDGDRQWLADRLLKRGVETAVHYPTLVSDQPAYAHLGYKPGVFPVAARVASSCLSLPIYPEMTQEQVDWVIRSVRECMAELDDRKTLSRAA